MTDDRDEFWRAFDEEELRPESGSGNDAPTDMARAAPTRDLPRMLDLQKTAISESVENLDKVIAELHRAAHGSPPLQQKTAERPATPMLPARKEQTISGSPAAPAAPPQSRPVEGNERAAKSEPEERPGRGDIKSMAAVPRQVPQKCSAVLRQEPAAKQESKQAIRWLANESLLSRPAGEDHGGSDPRQKTAISESVENLDQVIAELHRAACGSPPLQQKAAEPPATPMLPARKEQTISGSPAAPAAAAQSRTVEGNDRAAKAEPEERPGRGDIETMAAVPDRLAGEDHGGSDPRKQKAAATSTGEKTGSKTKPATVSADGIVDRVDPQPRPEPDGPTTTELKKKPSSPGMVVIDGDTGPIKARELPGGGGPSGVDKGRGGGGGGGGGGDVFHKRLGPIDFSSTLKKALLAVRTNLAAVMIFTIASNVLVLSIPVYLFQISDRVLTSRSVDTLIMLTVVIIGAVILQATFDAIRRFILMRTAVEVAAQLGAPILSAAARASLHSSGREYQTLSDLQQLRSFLVSGTLLAFLDAPMAPLFILAVFLIHPHLGVIVVSSALFLLIITLINQRATAGPFGEANAHMSKANLHLDSMTRNSQIINALAMIPEAVRIWGKDTANSLKSQVIAQDRNIAFAALSKATRLLTQVAMLGWGAHLAIDGFVTGGMVIAASIIAGRALTPIEGAIEGWNQFVQSRAAYGRISTLLQSSPLNFERLNLPRPQGRLDVERLLFVPQGTKRVVLNGITFSLNPGDSLAIIGNSGAGKTTLGKMIVGSILPTSGNVRLDLMDLRNWDQRQFGENIGYLPQDVQLFPASIKANIARMREDATDAQIYEAAQLADVHEMIASLAQGYETFVAADGAPLSGGQKQRIALARAFFGNPRLVVLDEPNSNLDGAGDAALGRALQHAKEQKITVITITQRPALLKSVDKILLLVNGTVALFGMRQDVLQALASRGINLEGGSLGQIR